VRADVLVVGGGYTGLWSAWFLTELEPSLRVAICEQDIVGGGPSGRNGGFVNSWWNGLGAYARRLGDAEALALCRAGAESVREIGAWCEANGVDAWYARVGDLGVSVSPAQDGRWRDTLEAAERLGVGDLFEELPPEGVRALCDSPLFRGGVLLHDSATVQPARLARGLRRALLERGVRIFEGTPVRRFRAGPPAEAAWPAEAAGATVSPVLWFSAGAVSVAPRATPGAALPGSPSATAAEERAATIRTKRQNTARIGIDHLSFGAANLTDVFSARQHMRRL